METASIKTATLAISSPSFNHEEYIPTKYSCEGEGINPPLNIHGIPENTKSLVIIIEDPDAPNHVFDHWLVWNIPPSETIEENSVPGIEGKNGRDDIGYTGPCPPSGTHRYFFRVFAIDQLLDLQKGADKSMLSYVMQSHVIAYGELVGLYSK